MSAAAICCRDPHAPARRHAAVRRRPRLDGRDGRCCRAAGILLKIGTAHRAGDVVRIVDTLDIDSLQRAPTEDLALNAIGRSAIETPTPVAFDPYAENRGTGAFILIDRSTHAYRRRPAWSARPRRRATTSIAMPRR